MQQQSFTIKENDGVYYLYEGDEKVITPNGAELWTKSRQIAECMINEARESGLVDWEDCCTVTYFQAHYCEYTADQERLEEETKMMEEVLYGDDFWGFDEPKINRAAVVSIFKQNVLSNLQNLPLGDRIIFLTTAEILNTIILPHKIICAFYFKDSPYTLDEIEDFAEELDEYACGIGLPLAVTKEERVAIWTKLIRTIGRIFLAEQ